MGGISRRGELGAVSSEIARLKGEVGRGLYQIGRLLKRLKTTGLWREGSFVSFEDWARQEADMSRATAYQFMRVAEHFNARIAERYGVTKLDAALRYLRETPAAEEAGDLLAAQIRVRTRSGRFRNLSLHEATATQIDEATLLLRTAKKGGHRIGRKLRGRLDQLSKALPAAPTGSRAGQRVRATRGRDGRVALSFQAIPDDELENSSTRSTRTFVIVMVMLIGSDDGNSTIDEGGHVAAGRFHRREHGGGASARFGAKAHGPSTGAMSHCGAR